METRQKVYKPYVSYKVDRKTGEIHKPSFYEHQPNIKKIVKLEGDKFFFFFYNKDTGIWHLPQNINQKNEEIKKSIYVAFIKIKRITAQELIKGSFLNPIKQLCILQSRYEEVKKANEEFRRRKEAQQAKKVSNYSKRTTVNEEYAWKKLEKRFTVRRSGTNTVTTS